MKRIIYTLILTIFLSACNNSNNNMKYKEIVKIPEAS
jgi:hypothetical protein